MTEPPYLHRIEKSLKTNVLKLFSGITTYSPTTNLVPETYAPFFLFTRILQHIFPNPFCAVKALTRYAL